MNIKNLYYLMKMKLNSRKKNTLGRTSISIFFILVFYLFLNFFGDGIYNNILASKNNLKVYFLDNKEVKEENIKLKKEVEALKIKNIFANYYYNKSQELEKRLNFLPEQNKNRVLFNVFSQDEIPFYNYLILHKNEKKDIFIGDIVYLYNNFVLGRVDSVEDKMIKVSRFYDNNVKEKYIIMNKGKVIFKGEGFGNSNGLIKMDLPRDIVVENDSVIILEEDSVSIVGIFLKDDFESKDTKREVYFSVIYNPENVLSVEI